MVSLLVSKRVLHLLEVNGVQIFQVRTSTIDRYCSCFVLHEIKEVFVSIPLSIYSNFTHLKRKHNVCAMLCRKNDASTRRFDSEKKVRSMCICFY
jgi:hypothetical protein